MTEADTSEGTRASPARRVLLFGIGNPGRGDDGLGPALAEALEARAIPGLTVDADYQLTIEDSAAIAEHDAVLFADADAVGPAPFSLRALAPGAAIGFSSHGVEPAGVLGLAEQVFGRAPPAYLLGIRGYEFDAFAEGLSPRAADNLARALAFIEPLLRAGDLAAARTLGDCSPTPLVLAPRGLADAPVAANDRSREQGRD